MYKTWISYLELEKEEEKRESIKFTKEEKEKNENKEESKLWNEAALEYTVHGLEMGYLLL